MIEGSSGSFAGRLASRQEAWYQEQKQKSFHSMEFRIAFAKNQRNACPEWLLSPGSCLFLLMLLVHPVFSQPQQAELKPNATSLLVWPFEDSFPIDYQTGSHSWRLLCGHYCGLHQGVDRFALDWHTYRSPSCGWRLNAPMAGKVIYVEYGSNTGYGNQIVLQSTQDSTFAVRMAHLQSASVALGEIVEVGDPIGFIGDTGNGGCHLHIVLYQSIYDISDPLYNPLDTVTAWRRAIDDLRINRFIDKTEPFSANFQFQATEKRLLVETVEGPGSFWPQDREVNGDIVLVNQDTQEVSGKMVVMFSEDQDGRLGIDIATTDTFSMLPGERRSIPFTVIPIPDANRYQFLQIGYADNRYPDYAGKIYTQPLYFYEAEKCLVGEPNNEPGAGEVLTFGGSPDAQELERFFGPEGDSVDYYRVDARRAGRLRLEQESGPVLHLTVVDSLGQSLSGGGTSVLERSVDSDQSLFVRASGRGSCTRPYRLAVTWEPEPAGEWLLWQQGGQLRTRFDTGDAESVDVAVYNALGQRIAFFQNEAAIGGLLERAWSLPNVSYGIYWVRIRTDRGDEFTRKIWWF